VNNFKISIANTKKEFLKDIGKKLIDTLKSNSEMYSNNLKEGKMGKTERQK
jgi:hypothetical protein